MRTLLLFALATTLACAGAPPAPDAASASDRLRLEYARADDEIKRGFIREELAKVELRRAREANTVFAYRRYLAEFPAGSEATTARSLLEALRFEQAEKDATVRGWETFLEEHPRGRRTPEARAHLGALEIRAALASDDLAQTRRTLARFPEHALSPELVAHEDALAWRFARESDLLEVAAYLEAHPSGAFRDEALDRREELVRRQVLEAEDLAQAVRRAQGSGAPDEDRATLAELRLRLALRALDVDGAKAAAASAPAGPAGDAVRQRAQTFVDAMTRRPLPLAVREAVRQVRDGYGPRTPEQLRRAILEADPLVRAESLRQLVERADPDDASFVLEALESRYVAVRLEAVSSLRTLASGLRPAVWKALHHRLEQEALANALTAPPWRRVAALREADENTEGALPAWREVLRHDPEDLVAQARVLALTEGGRDRLAYTTAARELAQKAAFFGDDRWLQPQNPAASPESRRDGPGVVVGVPADVTVLRQLCAAVDLAETAGTALKAQRAQTSAPEQEFLALAIADLDRVLGRMKSKRHELQRSAARRDRTLVPCGEDRVSTVLTASRQARANALRRLGELGDVRVVDFVEAQRFSPSAEVRGAATEALGALQKAGS